MTTQPLKVLELFKHDDEPSNLETLADINFQLNRGLEEAILQSQTNQIRLVKKSGKTTDWIASCSNKREPVIFKRIQLETLEAKIVEEGDYDLYIVLAAPTDPKEFKTLFRLMNCVEADITVIELSEQIKMHSDYQQIKEYIKESAEVGYVIILIE